MVSKKIKDLDDLASICEDLKKKNKTIVHCHGCFDLIHPGHVKHLEAAKQFGDILVVTITKDKFVNKGPGRPVFSENLRMESIAALEFVDYVALNKWEPAIKTIELLKPNFYVKGKDYSDSSKDVTGNIIKEEEAVNKIGGSIRFTDEISYSSSKLINIHFDVLSPEAKKFLEEFKTKHTSEEIIGYLKKLSKLNVMVIGEPIIDEYIYCRAVGKPEKASIVSTKYLHNELFAGGSLAIANHVSRFAKQVYLVGYIGKGGDNYKSEMLDRLNENIKPYLIERHGAPTIRKTRYIENFSNKKMFEVTAINDQLVSHDVETTLIETINEIVKKDKIDLIIVGDFGHGLFTQKLIDYLIDLPIFVAVNAQTNSMNFGFNLITRYHNIDFISIDERELRLPLHNKNDDIRVLVPELAKKVNCQEMNITLGDKGSLFYSNEDQFFVPVFSERIIDTIGAGDAVLSITSLLAKNSTPPEVIPLIGNLVGALAVLIVGNKESIDPIKLFKFIEYTMK